jgi:hypothetical protein
MLSFWINYVCATFSKPPTGGLTKLIGNAGKSKRQRNMADPAGSPMSPGTRSVHWYLYVQRISEMAGEAR